MVAFVSNIAHWSDVGGRSPGVGTAGDSTEILQEGVRIPPLRIVSKGQLRNDLLDFLLLNMRDRHERLGDFRAQIAALKLGERRLQELFDHYGTTTMLSSIMELQAYSERYLRTKLREIPEGIYCFVDQMDDDGCQGAIQHATTCSSIHVRAASGAGLYRKRGESGHGTSSWDDHCHQYAFGGKNSTCWFIGDPGIPRFAGNRTATTPLRSFCFFPF